MNKEELLSIIANAEKENRSLTDDEKSLINQAIEERSCMEKPKEEKSCMEKPKEEKSCGEDKPCSGNTKDEKSCEEDPKNKEERAEEEEPMQDETPNTNPSGDTKEENSEEEEPKKDEESRSINNNKVINNKMEKRFNLMKELRSALETGKSFDLAEVEARAYTVTDEGEDVVQTDIYDIWQPLRSKNVLVAAGARTITGIKNNVQIPLMSAISATWEGETGAAKDGSGAFTNKKLTPKRICVKVPVSLQMLAQDSIGVENAIRADIQNAVNAKLEATILGSAAGDETKPAGLFYKATGSTLTEISTFAGLTDLEGEVEAANFEGGKYIISPKAKAVLRNMPKSAKSTQLVMEGGQIDGTDAFVTSHVADKNIAYGDFSNLVIATWDNVQVDVVRDTASVGNGVVTIVVNAFVDAAVVRPEAIKVAKVKNV